MSICRPVFLTDSGSAFFLEVAPGVRFNRLLRRPFFHYPPVGVLDRMLIHDIDSMPKDRYDEVPDRHRASFMVTLAFAQPFLIRYGNFFMLDYNLWYLNTRHPPLPPGKIRVDITYATIREAE